MGVLNSAAADSDILTCQYSCTPYLAMCTRHMDFKRTSVHNLFKTNRAFGHAPIYYILNLPPPCALGRTNARRRTHQHGKSTSVCRHSKTCHGDHSDKATTCPRRPRQAGPRDVILSQLTLDTEATWLRRPSVSFEGPLSGRLNSLSFVTPLDSCFAPSSPSVEDDNGDYGV